MYLEIFYWNVTSCVDMSFSKWNGNTDGWSICTSEADAIEIYLSVIPSGNLQQQMLCYGSLVLTYCMLHEGVISVNKTNRPHKI